MQTAQNKIVLQMENKLENMQKEMKKLELLKSNEPIVISSDEDIFDFEDSGAEEAPASPQIVEVSLEEELDALVLNNTTSLRRLKKIRRIVPKHISYPDEMWITDDGKIFFMTGDHYHDVYSTDVITNMFHC